MAKPAGRLRNFFAELKRRRVFRVASIYLVASWVAVQVATTVSPLMELPDWLPRAVLIAALVGLPVALILAWAFDVTPEGVERTDSVTMVDGHAMHPAAVRLPWLRPVVGVLTLVLLFGAAYTVWIRMHRESVDRSTAIAVFPFTVHGGPQFAYLREGMVNLLGTKLNGAGALRSVDSNVLLKAVASQPEKELTAETARRIAQRFGAKAFILGDVSEMGGKLTLAASMYDMSKPNDPPKPASVSGTEEDLFSLVDDLAKSLITSQFNIPATHLARTAGLTTNSLPALKAYLNGETEYRAARWKTSMDWFQRALVDDSSFALASYRLGDAAEWAADFEVVKPAAEQAFRNKGRLSEHDRSLVDAFHVWVNGDIAGAETSYGKITRAYPDDVEGWYRLGEILYHYNPLRGRSVSDAKPAFEAAIRLDPSQEPLIFHLMEIALYKRDWPAFDSLATHVDLTGAAVLRRTAVREFAGGTGPRTDSILKALQTASDGTVFAVASGLAQYANDFANAQKVATMMTAAARPPYVRGTGFLLLAQIETGRGRWSAAKAHLDSLATIHRASALEYRALYAASPSLNVSPIELRNLRADLERWNAAAEPKIAAPNAFLGAHNGIHAQLRAYLIGILNARVKQFPEAESQARLLEQLPDTGLMHSFDARLAAGIDGMSALEQGNGSKANAMRAALKTNATLDQIANSPFYSHVLDRFTLAEALFAAGRYDEAAPWYATIAQGRNEVYMLAPAFRRLAQIAEKRGDEAKAGQYYAAFAELWSNADPELRAVVEEARQRAKSLQRVAGP